MFPYVLEKYLRNGSVWIQKISKRLPFCFMGGRMFRQCEELMSLASFSMRKDFLISMTVSPVASSNGCAGVGAGFVVCFGCVYARFVCST